MARGCRPVSLQRQVVRYEPLDHLCRGLFYFA